MDGKQQKTAILVLILLCLTLMVVWAAEHNDRYALVVGNSEYQAMTKLANPVNDASDIAAELSNVGFQVDLVTNATLGEMTVAVQRFVENLQRTKKSEAALFYYAGHGVQFNGLNYLVPVNADIQASYELLDKTMGMDSIVRGLEQSQSDFNLIVLDACRDNPFSATRGGDRGLSVMGTGGRGSMVVFATSPGDVAQDGVGRNSPFTEAFLEAMRIPGVEIRQLITSVQRKVQDQTAGRQVPWVNMSYTGEFYFQTIEQQLARSQGELASLQQELAALEREIMSREAAITAAGSVEERRRLEAEQATSKALEAAKILEAQKAEEMERQAQEILQSQAAQDALRFEMDERLASQAEELNRQAEQRRTELEALRAQQTGIARSLKERLETIAQYNRSIKEIQRSYTQLLHTTLADLDSLYDTKVAQFRKENPRDPWETVKEHETRIKEGLDKLDSAHENDKIIQREVLENRLEEEINPLLAARDLARSELQGQQFEVPMDSVTVDVDAFDAEAKHFPISVAVDDGLVTFSKVLFYRIESRDRDVLRREYYRVYSAAQSEALVGRVAYRVFETKENLWTVIPEYIEIINLLENDTVIAKAWERGPHFIVTTPISSFRTETTVLQSVTEQLDMNIFITGLPKEAVVYINGESQEAVSGSNFIGYIRRYSSSTIRIESPWLDSPLVLDNTSLIVPPNVAYCDVSDLGVAAGYLYIPRPDLVVSIRKVSALESSVPLAVSDSGYSARLAAGMYNILARLPEDSQNPYSASLVVKAGETTVFDPGPVELSLEYRYEEAIKELESLREALNGRASMKTAGWSAVGVATAGVVGTIVSYFLYSNAIQNYNDAILSDDLTRYRNDAALWSKLFTASVAVGVVGGVAGGTVFAIDAPSTSKLKKALAEQEKLASDLHRQLGALKAREAMDAATSSLAGLDRDNLLGQETVLWFSLLGGRMAEPVQKTITPGSRTGTLPFPIKEGFSFAGWWTSLGSEGHEITSETLVRQSGPLVMYAKWIPEVYTVSFEGGEGLLIPPMKDVPYNQTIMEPQFEMQTGRFFAGWYTDNEFSYRWDFSKDTVRSDLTLFAKWTTAFSVPLTYVEGGSFRMGNSLGELDEKPVRTVNLGSFYIGTYEVTQDIYQERMIHNPSRWKGAKLPVEQVSWFDAIRFCNALSVKDGFEEVYTIDGINVICDWDAVGYRLPTEAEWEYAARGGSLSESYDYAGSNSIEDVAWYLNNGGMQTHPVGMKKANELGVYDMSGNVLEWVWDWYGRYDGYEWTNPTGIQTGNHRVLRGGSYIVEASHVSTTFRYYTNPSSKFSHYGFRVLLPASK